jgi:HlyD family secretion protein
MRDSTLTKLQKVKYFIFSHKKMSIGILVILIILGYFGSKVIFKATADTSYVTATVGKGSVLVSVSGSGQVEASSSIDLKSKVSGDISYVGIKAGDVVQKGKLLFFIDSKAIQKSIRDAELNLESTKLSFEKLKNQNSDENINADLNKVYEDSFNNVSSIFLDLPTIFTGLENLLYEQNLSDNSTRIAGRTAQNYRNQAEDLYYKAESLFFENQKNYRLLTRNSEKEKIEEIIDEVYETTRLISDTLKSYINFVDHMANQDNRPSNYISYQNDLAGYIRTINSNLSSLLSTKNNIKSYKDSLASGGLDIQSSLLSLKQKENSLQDIKDTLADYYVYAPFEGIISSVLVKKGDTASGTLATIITKQKIATISLNEIDIAKIKLGQKATLTFDAIDTLTITGEVSEIDSIGTVSQGVVSYNVKISFDVSDERIKPGMSVSASIITEIAQNVLIVPNSAIKNQNGINYVQIFDDSTSSSSIKSQESSSLIIPSQVEVVIGLVDDTNTEIISGLKEGETVVTRTIVGSNNTTKSTTPSLINAVGGTSVPARGAGMTFPRN